MRTEASAPPWHLVLESFLTPVAVADESGHVLAASTDFSRLLDPAQASECVRTAVAALPSSRPSLHAPVVVQSTVRSRSGQDLRCRVRAVWREDATLGWCLLHVDDPLNEARDPLTGLPGRGLLVERLRQAIAHEERAGGELEVVVLDLDRFKAVNDEHGHLVGDALLVETARRLLQVARPEDTVCRWGGDEFVLLLTDVEEADSEAVCARVQEALRPPVVLPHGTVVQLSASCGSVRARAGTDPVGLMHAADMLMYERKRHRYTAPEERAALTERLTRARARARALHDALEQTLQATTARQAREPGEPD